MSFRVRVVNDEDEAVSGAGVELIFTSILRGVSAEESTDSDGIAWFDGYETGDCEVFVNGDSQGTFSYCDGEEITVEV